MVQQINLDRLGFSGATTGDIVVFNGINWLPSPLGSGLMQDFVEAAQDAVGTIIVDTDTINATYDDTTPKITLDVKTQLSISSDTSGIKLVNDVLAPGNNKIYGTDASGVKGWYNSPSGADGNGIYSGSGNIGNGSAGSTTTATIPSGSSTFKIAWSGGNSALLLDTNTFGGLYSPSEGYYVTVANTQAKIGYSSGEIVLNTSGLYYNNVALISTVGGSVDAKAILDLKSTTKALFPPRMTVTDRNNMGATNNGAVLYNTDTHKLNLRANGSWVELSTGNGGIYGGSGSVPASVVATLTDNLQFNYNSGNLGIRLRDSDESVAIFSGDDGFGGSGVGQLIVDINQISMKYDSKGIVLNGGSLTIDQQTKFSDRIIFNNVGSPASIAADQNNYNPSELLYANSLRLSSSANVNITGLGGGSAGRILSVLNVGSNNITLKNNDANSGAAQQFALVADITLSPSMGVTLQYDGTTSKWRCIGISYQAITSGSGGIYGGSGTVPAAVNATITGGSFFRFQYGSGSTRGFLIDDSAGSVILKSKTQTGGVGTQISVENSQLVLFTKAGQKNMTMTDTTASWNLPNYFDPEGFLDYNNSAVLQIDSNLKGFLPPRMTSGQRDSITTPAQGLVVYNTTADTISIKQAGGWINIPTSSGGSGTVTTSGSPAANQIATFSAATVITGENELWYDTTNNRLGVGLNNPTAVVHAAGAIEAKGNGNDATAAASVLRLANTNPGGTTWRFLSRDDKALIIESPDNPVAIKIDANTDGGRTQFGYGMQYLSFQDVTISTNTDDWNINKSTHIIRANVTAACNVTGINQPANGRVVYIMNINSNNLTLKHQQGSIATYQFALPLAADMIIRQNMCIGFWYDNSSQKWRPLSN